MIFNKRTGLIFLACTVIIAGSILTWRSHKRLQIIEKEHASLAARLTALKTRFQTAESDLGQVKADLADEFSTITDKDVSAIRNAMIARVMAEQERRKTDPKFQKEDYEKEQFYLYGFCRAFFAKEHLTPDQTAKFINALVQFSMDSDDLKAVLQEQGLPANDPSGLLIQQQLRDAFGQAVDDIIGPDGYARYQTYSHQFVIRDMMGHYAANSVLIGSPMTLEQVDQMVDYVSQNNPDFQEGKFVNPSQIDWPAVDEQARKIMTPEQYDIFTRADMDIGVRYSRWRQKVLLAIDNIVAASKQNADDAPTE